MEQRTDAWFQARLGKVTASRVADVTAKTKTGWGASRANYMADLVVERLTGQPTIGFVNAAMQHGIDQEPYARAAYARLRGVDVLEIGFVDHPELQWAGASPDGLVGEDGLLEVKCPNSATHLDTLIAATIPEKYLLQMQFQMAATGRRWCDFCSFDPRMPLEMQLFVQRVERDDGLILDLEHEVSVFLKELDAKVTALRQRYGCKEAA